GGFGGAGGHGGGGGGGPSAGVLAIGTSNFTETDNVFTPGRAGIGGAPNGGFGRSTKVITVP
ncbi:MAG TPA: hypothetical protein VG432_16460, partial [Gemmatimonadaceae bacterium]|nr:hypothetical protein [Gemmatimonadaceae bacterium]